MNRYRVHVTKSIYIYMYTPHYSFHIGILKMADLTGEGRGRREEGKLRGKEVGGREREEVLTSLEHHTNSHVVLASKCLRILSHEDQSVPAQDALTWALRVSTAVLRP